MWRNLWITIALLLLSGLLIGCNEQRWLEVEPGSYTQVCGTDETSQTAAEGVRRLNIDRGAAKATLTLSDGTEIPLTFVARPRAQWPEGCPTNLLHNRLEVLDLEESELRLATLTLSNPILVRNCPREPEEVVLRTGGPLSGAGTARPVSGLIFTRADSCEQAPEFQAPEFPESLPWSAKGYELYSWTAPDGTWHYTLITGTNRSKTVEELTSGENIIRGDGWVQVTVSGAAALKHSLSRLPVGQQVFWRGTPRELSADAAAGRFQLPEEALVAEIYEYCQEQGLWLTIDAGSAAVEPGVDLQAILDLPEALPAGQRVELTFTLINHAVHPLYVLTWYTPLEGLAGEILVVRRDGERVPYEGILAMRGDPRPEDYVLLQPDGAAATTVDLTDAYDFSQPGSYTVGFISPRISDVASTMEEMAQRVEDLGPVEIVANTETVTIRNPLETGADG